MTSITRLSGPEHSRSFSSRTRISNLVLEATLDRWIKGNLADRKHEPTPLGQLRVHPRDVAKVGEEVTIHGWPARDGSDKMALSAITTERATTVIIEQVRQATRS